MLLVTKAISLNRIQVMHPILQKKPYAFFLYTHAIYRGESFKIERQTVALKNPIFFPIQMEGTLMDSQIA
jgi:hypothetical protein